MIDLMFDLMIDLMIDLMSDLMFNLMIDLMIDLMIESAQWADSVKIVMVKTTGPNGPLRNFGKLVSF